MAMSNEQPPDELRVFLRLAILGTSTLLGFGAASLVALRRTEAGLSLAWTVWVPVAFVAGVGAGWFYWRVAGRMILSENRPLGTLEAGEARTVRRKFVGLSAGLGAAGLGAFLYPLRFVPREKLSDIGTGLGAAFVVLSLVGVVLWRVKRFLDSDTRLNEEEEKEE